MPRRVSTAVTCLALTLVYCASSASVSAQDSQSVSSSDTSSTPRAASGKTVRTELEYLTSRQTADPRKASKSDDGQDAEAEIDEQVAPAQAKVAPAQRASRTARQASAVQPATKPTERSVSSSLSKGKADRASSRSRKNAHKSSKWSVAFLFSGLRNAIISGRVQYLPLLGAAPVRFQDTSEFDRSRIIGFREYDERMDEVSFRTKSTKDAEADASGSAGSSDKSLSAGDLASKSGSTVSSVSSSSDSGKTTSSASAVAESVGAGGAGNSVTSSTSVRSVPKIVPTNSASAAGVDYVPVSTEVVMKYFDNGKSASEVKVGMPFVMPYQSDQPLIMDSNANYSQSEGGTQNGTSAK